MDIFAELQKLASLIRQLQGALGGNRIVRGIVSPAGAIVAGSEFTAVKNATGDYTVTFTPAFSGVPAVDLSLGKTANVPDIKIKDTVAVTATAFSLITYNSGVALLDAEFHFIAIGPP